VESEVNKMADLRCLTWFPPQTKDQNKKKKKKRKNNSYSKTVHEAEHQSSIELWQRQPKAQGQNDGLLK
jgi:hypothetical protein